MLLHQTYRREVPERRAFLERTLIRGRDFCVAIVRSWSMAIDRGVLGNAVKFVRVSQRPQLSLMLAGSGYVETDGRVVSIRAGELLETDQRLQTGEGYGGTPCEVVIVDWTEGGVFAGPPRQRAAVSQLSKRAQTSLRAHVARSSTMQKEQWVLELAQQLESLGLLTSAPSDPAQLGFASPALVQLYSALGPVLSRLDQHPSLTELAEAVGASERQTKRRLAELSRSYRHSFLSWRDFLHEMRLDAATQLLSVPGLTLERVSELAGYRSTIALHHAFALRGAQTPSELARRLRARWGADARSD